MRLPLIAGLLGSLLIAASPGVAHAHADAVSSSPRQGSVVATAPSVITIRFNENISLASIPPSITSAGASVPMAASLKGTTVTVRPLEPLRRGITYVTWGVLSDDGHPVSGVLAFVTGRSTPRGPTMRITTTPAIPATLSGSNAGRLSVTFGKAGSSGEVEWTHPNLPGPITWRVLPGSRTATGVLPLPGTWHMKATLESPAHAVVIVNGEVTLRG